MTHAFGEYTSISDGAVVIVVLFAWNFVLNMLSFHVPFVERLVSAPPLQVVRNGQLLLRNMRREFLTKEELVSHLREQGVDNIRDVIAAYIKAREKLR